MINFFNAMMRRIALIDSQIKAEQARVWHDAAMVARLKRLRLWLKDNLFTIQQATGLPADKPPAQIAARGKIHNRPSSFAS